METRQKIRELIESMNGEQRQLLTEELKSMVQAARPRVAMEDITAAKLRDPEFAARVRAEIDSALRGEI